jgi:hypothetical protein
MPTTVGEWLKTDTSKEKAPQRGKTNEKEEKTCSEKVCSVANADKRGP